MPNILDNTWVVQNKSNFHDICLLMEMRVTEENYKDSSDNLKIINIINFMIFWSWSNKLYFVIIAHQALFISLN